MPASYPSFTTGNHSVPSGVWGGAGKPPNTPPSGKTAQISKDSLIWPNKQRLGQDKRTVRNNGGHLNFEIVKSGFEDLACSLSI